MAGRKARPLTHAEVQKVLDVGFKGDADEARNQALFALGISTGYRIGEIVQHRISDVVVTKTISEVISLPSRMRKGGGRAQIKRLLPFARKALQIYIEERLEENRHFRDEPEGKWLKEWRKEWLFLSNMDDWITGDATHITTTRARQILAKAFDRAGVHGQVSPHSMRKTFAMKVFRQATEAFRSGRTSIDPLRVVQDHLGHANINSTIRYLDFHTLDVDATDFQFFVNE